MYKQFLFYILLFLICTSVIAQKGINNISIRGDVAPPFFQQDQGYGISVKGSYGMGKFAHLTFSVGVAKFNSNNSLETEKITTRLIPFLLGYKQHFNSFFIEPTIGIGELGGKIFENGYYAKPSIAVLFGGINAGYTFQQFTIGIGYLNSKGIENASAGIWYNKNFNYTSIFLSYDIFRKLK
ncbi:MAG: hypothetical protein ACOVQE_04260 [Chitinophagaceae bacterium]